MTSPSGRNFHLKTEGKKWHVPFCPIFLTCCCETCWGNIFCSSNYWKGQQPRGHSKLNVLSKPSMSIPSAPQVHTKYLWHSCCQLRIFWTHWAIFEFTAVYDAKRNRTEEVCNLHSDFCKNGPANRAAQRIWRKLNNLEVTIKSSHGKGFVTYTASIPAMNHWPPFQFKRDISHFVCHLVSKLVQNVRSWSCNNSGTSRQCEFS